MIDYEDTQRWLNKADPLDESYSAQIVVRSRVMATLCGRDPEQLKDRAHRYASAMNWHRAAVTIHRPGREA